MVIGIIQPNFFPWRGYFDFIDDVDLFVFLDNVQFTKSSFRNRNYIINTKGQKELINIPVISRLDTLIMDAVIDKPQIHLKKIKKKIFLSYKKSKFFDQFFDQIFDPDLFNVKSISDLNINLIQRICDIYSIKTKFLKSSTIDFEKSDKFSLAINICKKLNCCEYLSGPTAKQYTNENDFIKENIKLKYKIYNYPKYNQINSNIFIDNLSILDTLFNTGPNKKIIKSLTT
jgi:hypothetical protein